MFVCINFARIHEKLIKVVLCRGGQKNEGAGEAKHLHVYVFLLNFKPANVVLV